MHLVTRGDRLYAGNSRRYKKADGAWSSKTDIVCSLGSKKELLAKDPHAIEKLKEMLKNGTLSNIATKQTEKIVKRYTQKGQPFAGFPVLNYANYVLRPIWVDCLKLKRVLDYRKNLSKIEFDAPELLWQTVMNRIVSPCSHRSHFQKRSCWVGNPLNQAQLQHLYRMLDFAYENQEFILKGVNKAINEESPRDLSIVFYDVTNSWYETAWDDQQKLLMKIARELSNLDEGASEQEKNALVDKITDNASSTLRMRGPSKEHRPDPIVSVALVMDGDGIPIDFRVYRGNRSEKTTMRECTNELRRKFHINNTVVVADNGLNCKNNLLELSKDSNGFLLAHSLAKQKEEFVSELLKEDGWYCVVDQNMKPIDLKLKEVRQYITNEQGEVLLSYRLIVAWSQKRCNEDNFKIQYQRESAEQAIKDKKDINAKNWGWKRYIAKTKNKASEIDEKQIEKDKRLAGYFAYLFKDAREYQPQWKPNPLGEDISATEVIDKYRMLSRIENCFRIMKNNFDLRPLRVYTDEHIQAQVLICVLALIVLRVLARKLESTNNKMTTDQIIESLGQAKLMARIGSKKNPIEYLPLASGIEPQHEITAKGKINMYRQTNLATIMSVLGLKSLPPSCDRNALAHCLHTRFDTDLDVLGADYSR